MFLQKLLHNLFQQIIEITFSILACVIYVISPILEPIFCHIFSTIGIEINGKNASDIQVKDKRFYGLIVAKGLTGFADAYINEYIECDDLEAIVKKCVTGSNSWVLAFEKYHPYRLLRYAIHRHIDVLTPDLTKEFTNKHYEVNAEAIKDAFDDGANYSGMLMYDVDEVRNATMDKLDELLSNAAFRTREHIAKKLKLEPGMKVLDIGCGFGGLAKHLAENYKVEVTGVTICKAMAEEARKVCAQLPVKIIHNDYRSVTGKYDRVVSIEMFEHVGENHHNEYFEKVNSLLVDDGLFVFQANFMTLPNFPSYSPMFEKSFQMYCYFPRLSEVTKASQHFLITQDIENLGYCFGVTCLAASRKMLSNKDRYKDMIGGEHYRRGKMYGGFAVGLALTGSHACYQIVFSKNGLHYAYRRE